MNQRDTLLIVDDMEVNRAILRSVFERDYNILEAENGEQALMLLEQYYGTIAAMLLDVVMPVKDGYQVLTEMGERGLLSQVPAIVITAEGSAESEVRAFDLGASDIIMKPFEPYVVKRRVQNIVELNRHKLHLEELVEEQAQSLRESNEVMIDTLSSIIEYRSLESGQHVMRIRMFTKILLEDVARSYQEYDLDERKIGIIASAASMHDIGKIAIPDSILNKPGPLTPGEFEIMKTHAVKGCEILAGLDRMSDTEYLQYAYNICRYHHERWDGRGYPDGLRGENIPVCAQVVGLADCYDALTSDRVYKKAFPQEQAFNMILNGECGAFSPKLLECFKNVREQFDELSRAYADGRLPKADRIRSGAAPGTRRSDTLDTLQLGQMKYFSLLRFMDATVLEADLDTGVYHLVYLSCGDFELLRTGSSFQESIRNFAEGAVHPRDRPMVLELLGDYMRIFLEEGAMKRRRRYRVLDRGTGGYRWYEATLLRIDTENPGRHKIMIVWDRQQAAEGLEAGVPELPFDAPTLRNLVGGVQKCRNDKWFTLLYLSESFTQLLGYTPGEVAGQFGNRYLDMIYPVDREEVVRQTREQLCAGNSVELEYRVLTRDGGVVWVLDKGRLVMDENGEEYLYTVLVDVTQSKRAQEELRLTLERHKIILDQTNDIIFEWDIARDQLLYSSNWAKKFGYVPVQELVSRRIPQASHLHPEDIPNFMGLMRSVSSGVAYAETEFRVAKSDGRYIWCRIRATTQFDAGGKPIKAVGVILDIDSEKRASQALQDQAERDSLTKLYNKPAARRQVERYLSERTEEERAALLIIDVDNFKQVNDRFGHMFGDTVLTEISAEIRKLFRGGDVISRIGGDEFMVFMQRIPGVELAEDRARQIIAAFQGLFRESLTDGRLSCSIGIAVCPRDAVTYQDLFERADRALYRAKSEGKDQFMRYDHCSMDRPFGLDQKTAVGARIDSDESGGITTAWLVEQAFRMLYESGDVSRAVSAILELVGRQFKVSRAYIFERAPDGHTLRDTFEWCNSGVSPGLGTTHALEDPDLGGFYPDNFSENGIFYCSDVQKLPDAWRGILERQGIQSMLQRAIRDEGIFMGYVGFDDCTVRRMWTREQIDAITFISELISTFLLKKRAQERAVETAEDLRMVLDNQSSWIYVVDPETYELRYINAKTHSIAPDAGEGMCCYRAFMDRQEPCEVCPMRESRDKHSVTREIHNEYLGVWTLADASRIRWGGREACLLACHDITPYKREEPPEAEQN